MFLFISVYVSFSVTLPISVFPVFPFICLSLCLSVPVYLSVYLCLFLILAYATQQWRVQFHSNKTSNAISRFFICKSSQCHDGRTTFSVECTSFKPTDSIELSQVFHYHA